MDKGQGSHSPLVLTDEMIIILYTLLELENKYHFSFGYYNLERFLKGLVFSSVKEHHLYMITTYGSLKTVGGNIRSDIDILESNKLISKRVLFYNKSILEITELGKLALQDKKELTNEIISKKYPYHIKAVNEKGVLYFNFPKPKEEDPLYIPRNIEIINQQDEARIITILSKYFTSRQKSIYMMRYGMGDYEPMTLAEIGAQIGVTRERIRQILDNIERKLSKRMRFHEKFAKKVATEDNKPPQNNVLSMNVEDMNLSPRTINALMKNGIHTIDDILKKEPAKLRNLKGFGVKAYDQIRENLNKLGLETPKGW